MEVSPFSGIISKEVRVRGHELYRPNNAHNWRLSANFFRKHFSLFNVVIKLPIFVK